MGFEDKPFNNSIQTSHSELSSDMVIDRIVAIITNFTLLHYLHIPKT